MRPGVSLPPGVYPFAVNKYYYYYYYVDLTRRTNGLSLGTFQNANVSLGNQGVLIRKLISLLLALYKVLSVYSV
jgi:hypothetical protein